MGKDHLLGRGLLCAAQLVLLNFWAVRHLGHGLESSVELTGAVALITGVFGLMGWMSTDAQKQHDATTIRKILVRVFSFPLLTITGAALLTLVLVTSSVVVVNDFGETQPRILLARADRGPAVAANSVAASSPPKTLELSLRDAHCTAAQPAADATAENTAPQDSDSSLKELDRAKDDPHRFFVTTSPLGRPYLLQVKGYLPKPLDVYPLAGVTIIPNRDLSPSPSVLLRPDPDALATLSDGGTVIVTLLRSGNRQLIACGAGRSSFLIGSMGFLPSTIPQKLREDWRLELTRAGEDEQHTAGILMDWGNAQPLALRSIPDLESRMKLEIEIRSRKGQTVGRSLVTVREDELMDVSIPYLTHGPTAPPNH